MTGKERDMKRDFKKILALLMIFAVVLQYSFTANVFSVYAEDEKAEVVQTEAKAAAAESEPETKAEPAAEPKADPAPAPAQSEEPAPKPAPEPESKPSAGDETGSPAAEPSDAAGTSEEVADADAAADTDGEAAEAAEDQAAEPAAEGQGDAEPAAGDPEESADEEISEDAEEEPEDEEGYPAVTLSKTVNGVTVTLSAPAGALPEGAKLSVTGVSRQDVFAAVGEKLESEGKELTDAVAFDVTPLDKDGNEIQPRKAVTVTFSGTGLEVGDGGVDVFRVSDDAGSVTEMGTSVATADKQQFSTDHFTIYVAGGSTTDPNGDGSGANTQSNSYVLEYGESVTLDSNEGRFLSLWSIAPQGRGISLDGSTVTNNNSTSEEQLITITHTYANSILTILFPSREYFYITAKPQELTVTFMLQDAGESEFTSVHESTVIRGMAVEDAPEEPETKEIDGKTYNFYGWYTDEGCQTEADLTSVTENMTVYGKYTTPAKIHYNKNTSDSATVPADQEGGVGNKVEVGDATRSAYALSEWNTAADGSGTSYHPGDSVTMPEGGLTLYAQWVDDKMVMRYYYNDSGTPAIFRSVSNIRKNSQSNLLTDIPVHRPASNYVFLGWGISPSSREPDYYPGETYYTDDRDLVNLYAVWGQISELNLDIKTLTAKGETVTYDGQVHTIDGVEEGEANADGFLRVGSFRVPILGTIPVYADISEITATGLNAGHYSTPLCALLYADWPLTGYAEMNEYIEVTNNMLNISQAELTIITDTDEKVYDGEELTAGGKIKFTVNGEEKESEITHEGGAVTLIGKDTLNIRTIGSQTDIGQSDNEYELDWGKPDDWGSEAATARKFNYKFAESTIGTLTVTHEKFTITYDLNGGEYNGSTANIEEVWEEGTEISIHDAPTRDGYEFLYWQGSEYQPGDKYTVTEDHTFTAMWKEKTEPAGDDESDDADDPDEEDADDESDEADSDTADTTGTSSSDAVKTGDNSSMFIWITVSLIAAAVLYGLFFYRRREGR